MGGRSAPQPNVCAVWPQLFGQVKGEERRAQLAVWPTTLCSLFPPKGAPALSEVGQDAAADGVEQLNNATAHRS